ncbi:hypothetical protein QF026_000014 [Streptomyces aurantiacus]|uniref:hypothetical protein n=1 Tax=Streptomyces aurantiacus TaxID=47760 RepID=UPI0027902233|nr:hypothetical protein [Streptomyces aurantiacus]MDQ0771548.1 hypothetical protein [Streptomyces aurantiacus]
MKLSNCRSTSLDYCSAESRVEPTVEAGCKVTAGEWYSYYDGVTLTAPGGLDIDHMISVPATTEASVPALQNVSDIRLTPP